MGTNNGQNGRYGQNLVFIWRDPWAGWVNLNSFLLDPLQDVPPLQGKEGLVCRKATGLCAIWSVDPQPQPKTEPPPEPSTSHTSSAHDSSAKSQWDTEAEGQDGESKLDGQLRDPGQAKSCVGKVLCRPDEKDEKWRTPCLRR